MKKLILLGVISLNVVFGADCNAMIERYSNNPSAMFKNCIDNNNADACFCGAVALSGVTQILKDEGNIDKLKETIEFGVVTRKSLSARQKQGL